MDPKTDALLNWVGIGKTLVFGAAVLAVILWRWLQKRALDDINRKADELERQEREDGDKRRRHQD